MRQRHSNLTLSLAALFLALSSSINAQTQTTPAQGQSAAKATQYALEEVMVTAQRRVESLQEVPISVSAIGGDRIKEGGIMTVADIALETPNFSMTQFNVGEPQYFIRGIGNTNDSAGSDPAVGTFIDDVYIGRTGGTSMDLFDIERVEVLRGPQGTLFGKNVVGGAISIYTLKPSAEFAGKVGLTVGNYDQIMLTGLVNGSLSDTVYGKFSFSRQDREGYVNNVIDEKDYHDQDNLSLRGQLLFVPSDDLEILVGLDYSEDDLAGNCRNVNNLNLHNPLGLAPFYPPVIAATTGGDIRKCASSAGAYQEREVGGALLRIDWRAEMATFTSITAYREADYEWSEDLASMPLGTTPFNLVDQAQEESDQVSQEFRVTSNGGQALDWLIGAFYMKEDIDRSENFIGAFGPPIAAAGFVLLDGDVVWTQDNSTTSTALFAKIDWHLGDQLTWSVGARYARDKKEIDQAMINQENPAFDIGLLTFLGHPNPRVVLGIPANGPGDLLPYIGTGNPNFLKVPFEARAEESWNEFLPSTSLSWQFTDNALAYFTFSKGYKSGAFQSQTTTASAAVTPLDPEKVTNYEFGIKTEFADNRVRINASAFQMDYKDLQVFRLVGSLLVGANAEATSKGFEVDAAALLTEDWMVGVTYGYLDATYDVFESGPDVFSGNKLPRAPKNSWSINSTYTAHLPGGSAVDFFASYSGKSSFYFDASNIPASREGGIELLDARISWRSSGDRWTVSAWGRNLTDEEFRTHSITSNIAGTVDLWNLPRTYGLTVTYGF